MGLSKWIISKGHVGTVTRKIGDLYVELKDANPHSSPEEFAEAFGRCVAHMYGYGAFTVNPGLRSVICGIIRKNTGQDPRYGNEKFDQISKEIMIEELRQRGIPDHVIQ